MQSIKDFLAANPKLTLAISILCMVLAALSASDLTGVKVDGWITSILAVVATLTGIAAPAPQAKK